MKRALAIAAVFGALAWLEHVRPLRRRTQPRARRMTTNVAMAAITAIGVGAIQGVAIRAATAVVERRRLGLARLPRWPARIAGLIVLDYTLWHWHRMLHRVPLLWALHASHHADPDLDVSTALRFHVGEMLASVPLRVAQVLGFGIDRATLRAWETALLVAIAFHHSNLRLPRRLDAALAKLVITPRLHGIHHAARPLRLDTNFGTLLSVWDVVHGTLDTQHAQHELVIGLPRTIGHATPTTLESLLLPLSPALVQK